MNLALRRDADAIIRASLAAVLPDAAVQRALRDYRPGRGRTMLVAVGKAAWQMAKAALDTLGRVDDGVVITKRLWTWSTVSAPTTRSSFCSRAAAVPSLNCP